MVQIMCIVYDCTTACKYIDNVVDVLVLRRCVRHIFIKNFNTQYGNNVYCTILSSSSSLSLSFAVSPVIISNITDISDNESDFAIFICQAVGSPILDISWYLNNAMISNSSKYMIMSKLLNTTTIENTLTVYDITSADVGVYTCTATNDVGNDTSNGM